MEECLRKIWSKSDESVFESEFAERNLHVDKVLKMLDYPAYFKLTNQNLPFNKPAILEKLEQDQLIKEVDDQHFHITNLGAILFAVNLDEFDSLSRKAMRVIFYRGKNRLEALKEKVWHYGYAVGFKGLVEFIDDRLPMHEEIGIAFRKEVKMFPEQAIRELVANAVIHQDFSIKGVGPMVEIFTGRIEISNPGSPLIDFLRFKDCPPQFRNEKLTFLMKRMGICAGRGRGIHKVIDKMEDFQAPAPQFITAENFTRVILYAPKPPSSYDQIKLLKH